MADAFNRDEIYGYDILAIQEPYRNPFQNTTYHPAKDRFHLLYLDSESTRTCLFISKRIDPSTWNAKHINKDICVLQLKTPDQGQFSLYNVYNEPGAENTTRTLEILEQQLEQEDPQNHLLVLGDFNLHHPQWSGPRTQSPSYQAYTLLRVMENTRLWQITPRGTKTHRWCNIDTTIDLAFATSTLRDQLLHCKVAHGLDCDSDHLPISVQFNWEWKQAAIRKTRRWAATDVDKLRKIVQNGIIQMQLYDADAPEKIDNLTTQLVQTLTKAIDESTPWNNPLPRALPGFNKECKEARAETQRLRRKWQTTRTEDDRKVYKRACNSKKKLISKHLKQAHREKVTEAVSTPKNL
jgi:hypothetical protein